MKANYCTQTYNLKFRKKWGKMINKLSEEDAGQLLQAVYAFANGDDVIIENDAITHAFNIITEDLENSSKWFIENVLNGEKTR